MSWHDETLIQQFLTEQGVDSGFSPLQRPWSMCTTQHRLNQTTDDPQDSRWRQAGWLYQRAENPNHQHLEQLLARLDRGQGAMVFSSGMAAASAFLLSLKPESKIVVPDPIYYGLGHWIQHFQDLLRIQWIRIDPPADAAAWYDMVMAERPDWVWIEMPTNPMLRGVDLCAISQACRQVDTKILVDHTLLTPILFKPLGLGADMVIYSASKAMGGHHDFLAGVLVTNHLDDTWHRIKTSRRVLGGVLGNIDAWLLQRSLMTVVARIHRASDTAMVLANMMHHHPNVKSVYYPGLWGHSDLLESHSLGCVGGPSRFGFMISLQLVGGLEMATTFMQKLKLFRQATSFGGTASQIELRGQTKGENPKIPDDLIRMSVGLENPDDLVADIQNALNI